MNSGTLRRWSRWGRCSARGRSACAADASGVGGGIANGAPGGAERAGFLRWSAHVAVSRHDGRTSGGRSGRELEGGGAVKLILLPEPSIKVRELARVWGVTSCWLRKLIGRGELEAVRLGRDWVVPWRRQIDF